LVTLGNPEYEAFVQNMFKLVRWASGVVRRQRFVNRICPCDTDEMSVEGRWDYGKLVGSRLRKSELLQKLELLRAHTDKT
jgi:hypothetical protein